jgi:transcriptional regulator with XRE-family HTH domain
MAKAGNGELTTQQSHAVAAVIREELARRRISRQRLADEAKISVSTLEKALGGSRPFTLATLIRLEHVLGKSLREQPSEKHSQDAASAPDDLGGYARTAVAWLEGAYLTLRPSFETADAIYAYRTEILWDAAAHCLVFREGERLDKAYAQKGVVSMPSKSGHIYLHTNEGGQMRLAILGRPLIAGEMYGLLTTLLQGVGSQLVPTAVPLALIPIAPLPDVKFGRITREDATFGILRKHLDLIISQGFARI